MDQYIDAVCKELEQRIDFLPDNKLSTIYWGGGTPSLLSYKHLNKITQSIRRHYQICKNAEITLEANPDDLTQEKLEQLTTLGINRLSIGIQSFNNDDLKIIGRRHTGLQAIDAIKKAQKAGIKNISADLIFGLPFQTLEKWQSNLNQIFSLNIQHLSCYNLTYESGTAFDKKRQKGDIKELDEDLLLEMYQLLIDKSKQKDFVHYEISNFAKKNYFSCHNSNYWKDIPYLGIGASAHSYNGKIRQWNIANTPQYIKGIQNDSPQFEIETIDAPKAYNEFIMTGLRTMWGCNLALLEKKFDKQTLNLCLKAASTYVENNQLIIKNNILTIAPNAIFISDQIMSDLMMV